MGATPITAATLLADFDLDGLLAFHRAQFGTLRMEDQDGDEGDDDGDEGEDLNDQDLEADLDDEDESGDDEVELGPNGYPLATPVKDMTAEHQAAYWKFQARKHQRRNETGSRQGSDSTKPERKAKSSTSAATASEGDDFRRRAENKARLDGLRTAAKMAGANAGVVVDALRSKIGDVDLDGDLEPDLDELTDRVSSYLAKNPQLKPEVAKKAAKKAPKHTGSTNGGEGSGSTKQRPKSLAEAVTARMSGSK